MPEITVSMAFWAGLPHSPKNMDKTTRAAFDTVSAYQLKECWSKWRGPAYGNNGSMTIRWAHDKKAALDYLNHSLDDDLKRLK